MAGELQLGGSTVATHTGSGASAVVTIDNGVKFPAGHIIQRKAFYSTPADISTSSTSFTAFSNFDISINRTASTHAIYEVFGSCVSTEAAGRIVNIGAKRSDGSTYSGTNEVSLFNDSIGGNAEYFSNADNMRAPLVLKAIDTANISGNKTYRFFAKSSSGLVYLALNGGGSVFISITEFNPTT